MNAPDRISEMFPSRLAAVIRWSDTDQAYSALRAAAEAGVGSVEVTSGTPRAFELVSRLRSEVGASCRVGAGTITDSELARKALAAGAEYLVTPYLVPEVAEAARRAGTPLVMGATTPTEIAQAAALGADLVKIFPARPIGGADYVRAVRGPMPQVPLWVSGMVGIDDIRDYLAAGARVVGLTTDLFRPELLRAGRWEEIADLCRRALSQAAPVPV